MAREVREVAKKYQKPGDARYIPEARKYLGLLKNGILGKGVPTGVLRRTLPDGTTIQVDTRPGMDRIFIQTMVQEALDVDEELFLESGYLYLGATTGAIFWTQELQDDAELDDTYLDYMYGYKTSFRTRIYKDLMQSIPWSSGVSSETRVAALFSNANWGALPGKSRLFWQCAVGSKRAPTENIPAMYLAGTFNRSYDFKQSKQLSYNLYCSSNNDYYLIRSEETDTDTLTLSYAKISFTNAGVRLHDAMKGEFKKFRDYSARGDTLFTRLESYLFTQGKSVSEWTEIDSFECIGNPLTLSWNTNWNGDKAVMVCHEFVYYAPGDPNWPGVKKLTSRAYKYELTEDDDGNPTTVEVEMQEEEDWTPRDAQVFWFASVNPETGLPAMETYEPRGCTGEFPDLLDFDARVYAYYSDPDPDNPEIEKVTTLRCKHLDTSGPPWALDRLQEWRAAKPCRQTCDEATFMNAGHRIYLYMTEEEDDSTPSAVRDGNSWIVDPASDTGAGQVIVQAENGSGGYSEDFCFTISTRAPYFHCVNLNCNGPLQSECDRPYDPAESCPSYSFPTETYCNRPYTNVCGIGNKYNMLEMQCSTRTGYHWAANGGSVGSDAEQCAIIPFHAVDAVYVMQGHSRTCTGSTYNTFTNVFVDSFTPYERTSADGVTPCTYAPAGGTEYACYSAYGVGLGTDETGCCSVNQSTINGYTNNFHMELWLSTRTFTEKLQDETTLETSSANILHRDYNSYVTWLEPGWIMCFPPFTKFHPTLINASGSAVQSKWVYDGPWGDGNRDIQNNLEDDDSLDSSGYNGIWSGRI